MGPIERTPWQLDTPLSAEAVVDALVDFSPRICEIGRHSQMNVIRRGGVKAGLLIHSGIAGAHFAR
jgi:hypothetical protein